MIQEEYISSFVSKLNPNFAEKFSIGKNEFTIINKCENSINNQDGMLRDNNYLGRRFEYTLESKDLKIPIAMQLYENISGHYRLFCYTKNNKMLSSFNLSKGYNDGVIDIKIQIKVSTQKLTKEERAEKRGCQEAHCLRELQDRCQDRHADARTLHSLDVSLLIGNQK